MSSPVAPKALLVEDLHVRYGASHVIQGVSLSLDSGRGLALLGRNGVGKTTTLRALMGLIDYSAARLEIMGVPLGKAGTVEIVRRGMSLVLEDRGVFPSLTVRECLDIAASFTRGAWTIPRVIKLFPRLGERLGNRCNQLSGGEQQMLAVGRALLLDPRVLLLDEPTQGLAPAVVRELLSALQTLKHSGISLLVVEQNFEFASRVADDAAVLGRGAVRWCGPMRELLSQKQTIAEWLGA